MLHLFILQLVFLFPSSSFYFLDYLLLFSWNESALFDIKGNICYLSKKEFILRLPKNSSIWRQMTSQLFTIANNIISNCEEFCIAFVSSISSLLLVWKGGGQTPFRRKFSVSAHSAWRLSLLKGTIYTLTNNGNGNWQVQISRWFLSVYVSAMLQYI